MSTNLTAVPRGVVVRAALVLGLALAFVGAKAPSAHALCATPMLSGDWQNVDANTRAMTRAVVRYGCGDVVHCDADTGRCSSPGGGYSVRMFGKCRPTDCNWGEKKATYLRDGWIRIVYRFGFKTSDVRLKAYSRQGQKYLRVWVSNDFTRADGRGDYVTDEWFVRS